MRSRYAVLISLAFVLTPSAAQASHGKDRSQSSASASAVTDAAPRLLELVNRERAAAGLAALDAATDAAGIAEDWSGRMARAGDLSHNDDYFTPATMDRLRAVRVGENVAFADTVDEIHDMFMQSPRHRDNILHPEFREVGFGAARTDGGQLYVTEDFLTRRPEPADGRPAAGHQAPAGSSHPAEARSSDSAPRSSRPAKSPSAGSPRPSAQPRPGRRPRLGSPPVASRPAAEGTPRPAPAAQQPAAASGHPKQPTAPEPAASPTAPEPAAPPTAPVPPAGAALTPAETAAPGTPAAAVAETADTATASAGLAPSPDLSAAIPAFSAAAASHPTEPLRDRGMLAGAAALALVARIRRRRR